jgi:outer membrane protein
MKRSLTFVCILASGFGATALAQASSAPATPAAPMPSAPGAASVPAAAASPAKVAIIQFQQAVGATNEGQRDFAELRKKFEPKQTQLKTESDEIDALKKQLQTQSASLSDSAKADLTRKIDEKTKSLQRAAEDAQNDFQTEMGETYQKLAEKVYQVVQTYAAQAGYTLVLDASAQQSPVLWATQGTDISQGVVEAYNQKSGVPAQAPASAAAPSTTPRPTTPARSAPKPATTPQ